MTATPADKFIQTITPLLHLWQSVRASGAAVNVNGQWLNVGIRVELRENLPSTRDVQSSGPRFLYYVIDYSIDRLPGVIGQLTREHFFTLQDDRNGHGTSAQILLRPSPASPSSPISWYGPQRRESKSPRLAGETQRSAIAIGAIGEHLGSLLDYDFRQELDTILRQAEPGYDGLSGLAQHLFPGTGFGSSQQMTLIEIVADLPFEIQFIGEARLVVRASPRIADSAFTGRCFYEPGTKAKPPLIVFRQADATAAKTEALQWDHPLSWPADSKAGARATRARQNDRS